MKEALQDQQGLVDRILIGIQLTSVFATIVLGFIVAVHRKQKVIATSPWFMLEFMLLGSFLLYLLFLTKAVFPVMMVMCLLEPWLREVGFILLYGTIAIKLYRLLVECRTRKAHRWVVRNHDMLKYIGCMLLMAVVYLTSGTVGTLQYWTHLQNGENTTENETTKVAVAFRQNVCPVLWWHFVNSGAEMIFLSVGIYIAVSSRNTQSDRAEYYRLLTILILELFVSASHTLVSNLSVLDEIPVHYSSLEFLRCQATVSVVLLLQFAPKAPEVGLKLSIGVYFLGVHSVISFQMCIIYRSKSPPIGFERPSDSEVSTGINAPPASAEHQIPEVFLLNEAHSVDVYIKQNGDVDVKDEELIDLDPDVVKAELKRVYTQLHVLRNRSILCNNPHLIKKRSRKLTRKFSRIRDQGKEKIGSRRPCKRREGRSGEDREESVISTEGFSLYISENP